ncbi:MAG: FHA domain-containing protein [Lachnospiraceae bacterium]|nr:FHA domain-containing protein [Lachnospiraceae bacterium]
MSEISFIKEQDRNRLVVPTDEESGYSLRMLEKRRFDGLMPVEIRSLNGESFCCYDVSGTVPLLNRCRTCKPGREEIDSFFDRYVSACSELEDYLMDPSGIMLDPGYIFYDMGTGSYRFVLDPSGNAGGADTLLAFLTENVDPSDEEAVSVVYKLCEMSMGDENFSLLPALESMNMINGSEMESILTEPAAGLSSKAVFGMGIEPANHEEEEEPAETVPEGYDISKIYLVSAVIGIVGLIGAAALYLTYEMTMEELCVTAACAAVMLAVTVYSLKVMENEKKRRRERSARSATSQNVSHKNTVKATDDKGNFEGVMSPAMYPGPTSTTTTAEANGTIPAPITASKMTPAPASSQPRILSQIQASTQTRASSPVPNEAADAGEKAFNEAFSVEQGAETGKKKRPFSLFGKKNKEKAGTEETMFPEEGDPLSEGTDNPDPLTAYPNMTEEHTDDKSENINPRTVSPQGDTIPGYTVNSQSDTIPGYTVNSQSDTMPGYTVNSQRNTMQGYTMSPQGDTIPGYTMNPQGDTIPGYTMNPQGDTIPGYTVTPQGDTVPDPYTNYAMEDRTVMFTDNKAPEEFRLYSLNGGMPAIGLDKLPAIVGKISSLSDICLPDPSVSRLHARFDKEDGRVTVTDLDSTNGTYINGKRLKPNETCTLRSGDELRIGVLNYCMR